MRLTVGRNPVSSISGLVVEYIVAIDVTQVRFPADALSYAGAYNVGGAPRWGSKVADACRTNRAKAKGGAAGIEPARVNPIG